MLFDLRGRGRRRTIQGVYLGLALLLGGGLVLFGVGSGTGGGGLLNGLSGNGSGSNSKQVVSQQEQSALKLVKHDPNSSAAWSALIKARWAAAGQTNNYNSSTGTFTAAGQKELAGTTQAWQRYLQLTKTPDPNLAVRAARAYAAQSNYAGAAGAWEVEAGASPTEPHGYECLAASAYAAKENRKADLALGKALTLVPKAQRTLLKTQIQQAKTQPAVARQC